MKRSYELLIAEKLQQGGFMTNIQDAVNLMSQGAYSCKVYHRSADSKFYIVTVVITEEIFLVYVINDQDESVELRYQNVK